jgi:hypothetical protein
VCEAGEADDNKENNKLINSEQKHAENIANNEHRGGSGYSRVLLVDEIEVWLISGLIDLLMFEKRKGIKSPALKV